MKKVGVVLAGCGYLDGAEIQEVVAALLALEKRGLEVVAMAPNIPQMHVVNHRTQDVAEYTRNVLIESSRITRGDILDLAEVDMSSLDAIVFPGGFGAAKNLCDFAVSGAEMTVNHDIRDLIIQQKDLGMVSARQSQSLKRLGQCLGRWRQGQFGQFSKILIFQSAFLLSALYLPYAQTQKNW